MVLSQQELGHDKLTDEEVAMKKVGFAATSSFFESMSEYLLDDKKVGQDIKVKLLNTQYDYRSFRFLPLIVFQSAVRKTINNKIT